MKDKLTIAYHEIGHALVAAKQKNSAPVHKIITYPENFWCVRLTMQLEEDDKVLMSKEEALIKLLFY